VSYQANPSFWKNYHKLPGNIQKLADDSFRLLKRDTRYPSLHFKKVGRFLSVRVGNHYRALAVELPQGIVWFWIGTHEEYNKLIN